MYHPADLARFALSEFERGIEGLSPEEALVRTRKADGTLMNAISWTVAHIATHWLSVLAYAKGEPPSSQGRAYAGRQADPTPPPLSEATRLLAEARRSAEWWAEASDSVLSSTGEGRRENVGASLMRVALHTWFHMGEINAVRQMLGHKEIPFVGNMAGQLEWRP